jgi:hypothetical protein
MEGNRSWISSTEGAADESRGKEVFKVSSCSVQSSGGGPTMDGMICAIVNDYKVIKWMAIEKKMDG